MQAPPPVPNLLSQLNTMASNLSGLLGKNDYDWKWKPAADEWSLTEVVCHLRDVEREIHQARFTAVLKDTDVFLVGVSADDWAISRKYQQQNGQSALMDYLETRAETISLLEGLPSEMWERQAIHSYLGRTSMHELLFLASRHDELHWEQIKNILAGQSVDEATPQS